MTEWIRVGIRFRDFAGFRAVFRHAEHDLRSCFCQFAHDDLAVPDGAHTLCVVAQRASVDVHRRLIAADDFSGHQIIGLPAAAVVAAQKVTTPEELDKAMKKIAPAQGAANKAIQSMSWADAKAQVAIVKQALMDTEGFWTSHKKDDAVAMLKDSVAKVIAVEQALNAPMPDQQAVLAAYKQAIRSFPAYLDAPGEILARGFFATVEYWLRRTERLLRENWVPYRMGLVGNYASDLGLKREINAFLVAEDPYGVIPFVRMGVARGEVRSDVEPELTASILEWTVERFQDALLTEELDPGLFPRPRSRERTSARI